MKGLIRLFVILNLAAGLVALVLYVDRRYAPRTPEQWRNLAASLPESEGFSLDHEAEEETGLEGADRSANPASTATQGNNSRETTPGSPPASLPQASIVKDGSSPLRAFPLPPCDVRACGWPGDADLKGKSASEWPAAPAPPRLLANTGPNEGLPEPADAAVNPTVDVLRRLRSLSPPDEPAESAADLREVDSFELMRQWHEAGEEATSPAVTELRRRGCTEVHLELARRLFDPNPLVRQSLAQALPRLQSVDAAPWLMHLAGDPESEVRLAAISLLATTADTALLERVEGLARLDSDPSIREQADRIERQRGMVGTRGKEAARKR